MNELNKALGDISSIRRQVARTTEFRGYGWATLGATSVFAALAALAQGYSVRSAGFSAAGYLAIWLSTAVVSAALIGVQMRLRSRRMHSGLADEMIRQAVEQFLPAAVAGALLMAVLVVYVPASFWMLPGLLQVVYALGVFSSCRFLPRPMLAAGFWYLFTGLYAVSLGDARALSPWVMGAPFAGGQLLVAGVLLLTGKEATDES